MKAFFIVFLIIISLMMVFLILTNKYTNPYKMIMYFGKKGSGKSTTLTKLALTHIKKGWTVYSTEVIPGTYFIEPEQVGKVQLVDFKYKPFVATDYSGIKKHLLLCKEKFFPTKPKILLLIDEVGLLWHSRDFKTFPPYLRKFWKLQRHYHVKCCLFSQSFDIDKSMRDLCDMMYLQKNVFRVFTYGKKIRKSITIHNTEQDGGKLDESFEFEPFIFFFLGTRTLTFIPHWSKYFKSFDAPELDHVDYDLTDFDVCSVSDLVDSERSEGSLDLDGREAEV